MKRKRGNKRGKQKKPSVVAVNEGALNVANITTEDNSGLDDCENDEIDSGMEAETLTSVRTDQPKKVASINSDRLIEKIAGNLVYGRVKVKIKTSKALDSQLTSSDAPTQSDTDKSSQQVGLEKHGLISEKMEDSANSLPEMSTAALGNSKKAGSIKIKSSRSLGSSSISPSNDVVMVQAEKKKQKETELLRRDPQYNKQELNASLMVIKKVMKMDAAEPFNVPVNPIALGIPDYFDVINTPMDFGTICSNLENGVKYMNSKDVFKDVQYIWENCYKYNNKGDYIVELMKRVKKNFTKYWTAAGLYTEPPQGISGFESIQAKDSSSGHGKIQMKGGQLKHKTRRRHGVKRHKDDCLCAICVMMRRRQKREEDAQMIEDEIGTSNAHLAQEMKPEENSQVESHSGEDTSSNMDNSLGPDGDAEADADSGGKAVEVKSEAIEQLYSPLQENQEEENDLEVETKVDGEISGHSQYVDRSGEDHNGQYQIQMMESSGYIKTNIQNEETSSQHEEQTVIVEQQKLKESPERIRKAKMYENLRRFENPVLLELCGSLFPDNRKSFWNGPHSLVQQPPTVRPNSIHSAIATFKT